MRKYLKYIGLTSIGFVLLFMLIFGSFQLGLRTVKAPQFARAVIGDTISIPVITISHVYGATTADYTIDGVSDNVEFQAALDALPITGGIIQVMSSGTISFGATVSRAINNVTIIGTGPGTLFNYDNSHALFSAGTQSGWTFRDFATDNGGVTYLSSTAYALQNVTLGSTFVGYRTSGNMTASYFNGIASNATFSTNSNQLNGQLAAFYTNATNLAAGTVPTARLGSGTANTTTFLRGDQSWVVINGSGIGDMTKATYDTNSDNIVDSATVSTNQTGGTINATEIKDDDLTSGRVVIAGASGKLADDSDFTFSGDRLTVTNLTAPTGRTATYVIAASDAPAKWKAQADITLDGTTDAAVIQSLIASNIILKFSPGTANLEAELVIPTTITGFNLIGSGSRATIFTATNTMTNMISITNTLQFSSIQDCAWNGNNKATNLINWGLAGSWNGSYCRNVIRNVYGISCKTGVAGYNIIMDGQDESIIDDCEFIPNADNSSKGVHWFGHDIYMRKVITYQTLCVLGAGNIVLEACQHSGLILHDSAATTNVLINGGYSEIIGLPFLEFVHANSGGFKVTINNALIVFITSNPSALLLDSQTHTAEIDVTFSHAVVFAAVASAYPLCNDYLNKSFKGLDTIEGGAYLTNAVNTIATPFTTSATYSIGLGGSTATVTASRDYVVNGADLIVSSTAAGTNPAVIVIKDRAGNTISTGKATLDMVRLLHGWIINWGAFTGTAPTITAVVAQ